ncbi:MAG: hypothetical protein LUG61_02560 [Lachnospiraceae bacterium]|nr:hypothetical protein [Lachnospiraceae bacterium]
MKDTILKVVTGIAGLVFVTGMAMMDSESLVIPGIMVMTSGAWLLLYFSINERYYAGGRRR